MSYTIKDLGRDLALGTATKTNLEQFDPEAVHELKANMPITVRSIANPRAFGDEPDEEKAIVVYNATVEVVDRMGDLILTRARKGFGKMLENGELMEGRGWETANFLAAGAPFLWSHLSRDPAIGQVVTTKALKIDTPSDGRVWATQQGVRYLNDERIPMAVPAFILVIEKIAGSVSVGFSATHVFRPDDETAKVLGLGWWGVVFLTSDQTELSQAQTPANQLALVAGTKAFVDEAAREARAREVLDLAAKEGREVLGIKVTPSLVKEFIEGNPLSALSERALLEKRLDGFFDMEGTWDSLEGIMGARAADDIEKSLADDDEPEEATEKAEDLEPVDLSFLQADLGEMLGAPEGGLGTGFEIRMADGSVLPANEVTIIRTADLEELRAQAKGDSSTPPIGMTAGPLERAAIERAFHMASEVTENLAGLLDAADAATKGLDAGGGEGSTTPEPDPNALMRSQLELARSMVALAERLQERASDSGGGASEPLDRAGDEIERGATPEDGSPELSALF